MANYICFSIDDAYALHCAAALDSILKNNNTEVNILILGFNLTSTSKTLLSEYQMGSIRKIHFMDINDFLFEDLPQKHHFTRSAYGRLLIPDILKDENTALYLDADVIILKDLNEVFNIDVKDFYVAGVANINNRALSLLLHNQEEGLYLDSGFLLFNLRKWRRDMITDEILKAIKYHENDWDTPDNDGINYVLRGEFLSLEQRYSYQTNYYVRYPETRSEAAHAVILQYAGSVKPSSYLSNDPFKHVYLYHARNTAFANRLHQDFNFKNAIKKFLRRICGNELS